MNWILCILGDTLSIIYTAQAGNAKKGELKEIQRAGEGRGGRVFCDGCSTHKGDAVNIVQNLMRPKTLDLLGDPGHSALSPTVNGRPTTLRGLQVYENLKRRKIRKKMFL